MTLATTALSGRDGYLFARPLGFLDDNFDAGGCLIFQKVLQGTTPDGRISAATKEKENPLQRGKGADISRRTCSFSWPAEVI